ncbi:MAG TPA: hypothetical protein VEY71_00200 [Chitinophagales bacterium]|nr:hypothetical protein [Chitinophagales bacterium]
MEPKVDTIRATRPIQLDITYDGDWFVGEAKPVIEGTPDTVCTAFSVNLNGVELGLIRFVPSGWKMDTALEQPLVDAIGKRIVNWYK